MLFFGGGNAGVAGCALGPDALGCRVVKWRRVAAVARTVQRRDHEAVAVFASSSQLIADIALLCAAETACCPSFRFGLTIAADEVVLTVTGPPDAPDLLGVRAEEYA